jgi:O-methyltransferase
MSDPRWLIFKDYLTNTKHLDGDIIEVGVHWGNSLSYIGMTCEILGINKTIYGIDTFEGLPSTVVDGLDNGWDINGNPGVGGHWPGNFGDTSLESVRAMMARFKNVVLIKGFFPDCATEILKNKFCFAHIDVDIYQSNKDAYELIWPQLVSGGVIICGDDYGKPWLKGATLAIDEATKKFGIEPVITQNGIHILIKP